MAEALGGNSDPDFEQTWQGKEGLASIAELREQGLQGGEDQSTDR